ncbi:MAG: efflux RND transporter periplasmic adaptor subunit [Burkholderiaceae bacterium]
MPIDTHSTPPSSSDTQIHIKPHTTHTLRRAGLIGLALLGLLLSGAAVRVYSKTQQVDRLAERTAQDAIRQVQTTRARASDAARNLTLPGTLKGSLEAPIYARTNGYLQRWTKDIGQSVKKGELLAVIDVPEAEQELLQARAASEQIRARLALTQSSLERWEGLRQRDAVSQQELDERRAAHQQARADLAAAEANVRRLEQLQSFRRVTAPFSGTVVRRNVDVGALIGAGNNGANRELFYLAQTDKLRVDVAVPQTYSAAVIAGQEVTVKLLERPGVPFKGTVARTAGAIDSATRSMQIEISIPNPDGQLMAGAYVEVSLPLANPVKNMLIPVNVLQFRQDGPRVAVVTADVKGEQRIALRNVKLGRDLGRSVEVLGGITPKDVLVLNPYDAIEDGERVVAQAAPQEKSDKAQGNQSSGGGKATAPATVPARSDKG